MRFIRDFLIIFALLMSGCQKDKRINDDYFPIDKVAEMIEISHPDSLVSVCWQLQWVDSMLAGNGLLSDHWVHIYDPVSGDIKRDIISRGSGPGEVLSGSWMRKRSDGWNIFDIDRGMVFQYDDSLKLNKSYSVGMDSSLIIGDAFFLDDDRILVTGRERKSNSTEVLCIYRDGNRGAVYSSLPIDFEDGAECLFMRQRYAFDEKQSCLVTGTVLGGIIETFNVKGDSIIPRANVLLYPLKIETDGNTVRIADDCCIGVTALCFDGEHILAALRGTPESYGNTDITVWNLDLEPLARYKSDVEILSMIPSTDNPDYIYAVVAENGGNPRLVKFNCPGIMELNKK